MSGDDAAMGGGEDVPKSDVHASDGRAVDDGDADGRDARGRTVGGHEGPRDPADPVAIAAWAAAAAPVLGMSADVPPTVTRIGGGYSNLTYRLDWTTREGTPRRAVLRRPPPDVVPQGGAHDMRREWRTLHAVHGSAVPVPTPLAVCEDVSVLGAPFYLMAHVDGTVVRRLDDAPVLHDADVMRRFATATIDGLATLHRLPVPTLSAVDAERAGTYGARQVEGWGRRWAAALVPGVEDRTAREVFAWLAQRATASGAVALLHNDWKFDNLLVDAAAPWTLRAVLDWEMATVGDPAYDLGTTLGYWIQPDDPAPLRALALGVTTAEGCLTREEVVACYARARGARLDDPVACWAFGLAKVAVIALQLYARHVTGRVADARYAALGRVAELLMATAACAIRGETLRAG